MASQPLRKLCLTFAINTLVKRRHGDFVGQRELADQLGLHITGEDFKKAGDTLKDMQNMPRLSRHDKLNLSLFPLVPKGKLEEAVSIMGKAITNPSSYEILPSAPGLFRKIQYGDWPWQETMVLYMCHPQHPPPITLSKVLIPLGFPDLSIYPKGHRSLPPGSSLLNCRVLPFREHDDRTITLPREALQELRPKTYNEYTHLYVTRQEFGGRGIARALREGYNPVFFMTNEKIRESGEVSDHIRRTFFAKEIVSKYGPLTKTIGNVPYITNLEELANWTPEDRPDSFVKVEGETFTSLTPANAPHVSRTRNLSLGARNGNYEMNIWTPKGGFNKRRRMQREQMKLMGLRAEDGVEVLPIVSSHYERRLRSRTFPRHRAI